MLTQDQNTVIYLMFLNGLLFLGLNFIAYSLVFPGPKGSKRLGYVLFTAALLAFLAQQEYQSLLSLGFPSRSGYQILLGGFMVPVFLISAVYYRWQRNRAEKKTTINHMNHNQHGSD